MASVDSMKQDVTSLLFWFLWARGLCSLSSQLVGCVCLWVGMSEKLTVRCSVTIQNSSSDFKEGEESSFEYIITNNNQNLVLESSVWMMMWQSVSLPLFLSPPFSRSSSGVRQFDAVTHRWRWFFKQLEGYPFIRFFFFVLCINNSNLFCTGAQMQVWI